MLLQEARTEAISGLHRTAIVTVAEYQSAHWSQRGSAFLANDSNYKRRVRRRCTDRRLTRRESL